MDEVPEPVQVNILDQFGELAFAMYQLRIRDVAEDPRTGELDEEWYACMADHGYDLAPEERAAAHPGPMAAWGLAVRTPPGGVAGPPRPNDPAEDIPVEERYLLGSAEEREIAMADFDCRLATDYEARLTAIHADELEELAALVALRP